MRTAILLWSGTSHQHVFHLLCSSALKSTDKLAVSLLLTVAAASRDKEVPCCCLGCAAEFDASKQWKACRGWSAVQ